MLAAFFKIIACGGEGVGMGEMVGDGGGGGGDYIFLHVDYVD